MKYSPCFVLLNHYSDSIKMYHILALSWRTWIGKGKLIQVHDWPISDTDQGWNPRKAWITQHRMLLTFRSPAVPPFLVSTKHRHFLYFSSGFLATAPGLETYPLPWLSLKSIHVVGKKNTLHFSKRNGKHES